MPVNGDSVQLQIDVLLIAAEAHAVGPGQIGVRIIDGTTRTSLLRPHHSLLFFIEVTLY